MAWPGLGLHAPELHDLRPAAGAVGDGAEKFAYAHAMAGFLHHRAARAGDGALGALELAARQHPAIVLAALDHGDQRPRAIAHHDAAARVNGFARHAPSADSFSKYMAPHAVKLRGY